MSFWGELNCPKCVSIIGYDLDPHTMCGGGGALHFSLPKQKSNKRIGPHNYDILSIIFGSLLGDGHAEKHGNGTRIRFYQEGSHQDYLLWLHALINNLGYATGTLPITTSRLDIHGKLRYIIRFNTYTYSNLNWIRECWYDTKNVKIIPSSLDLYLSPLALAIWIMDDGGKVSSGLKFCTNSFILSDVQKLSLLLNQKYELSTTVHSAGYPDQYVIYVPKHAIYRLNEIVGPYMHPSMKYKLG